MTQHCGLIDNYGRHLSYLRLSITDLCNYRCQYCMPTGGVPKLQHADILTLEEVARVTRMAVKMGVTKIRLTGGEPLLRRDLKVLLKELDSIRPRPELCITTNGFILEKHLESLARYGVNSINVSLDSLKPERYGLITGLGPEKGAHAFDKVWRGIMAALDMGKFSVKINQVVLKDLNHEEILDFARLTLKHPISVRYIEYMPVGRHTPFAQDRFFPADQIDQILNQLGPLSEIPNGPNDGPARRLKVPGAPGELGVINAISSHFCSACNRLRLTADGRLVPCLFSETSYDIRKLLRAGVSDSELAEGIMEAAHKKPSSHHVQPLAHASSGCQMSRLGG